MTSTTPRVRLLTGIALLTSAVLLAGCGGPDTVTKTTTTEQTTTTVPQPATSVPRPATTTTTTTTEKTVE
jgi:hypothetical protein